MYLTYLIAHVPYDEPPEWLILMIRYLLGKESGNFLRLSKAHLSMWRTCASYLVFSSLDVLFSTDPNKVDLPNRILNGDFVFFEYSSLNVLKHVSSWIQDSPEDTSISEATRLLKQLFESRQNKVFRNAVVPPFYLKIFESFQEDSSLQSLLSSAEHFWRGANMNLISVDGMYILMC